MNINSVTNFNGVRCGKPKIINSKKIGTCPIYKEMPDLGSAQGRAFVNMNSLSFKGKREQIRDLSNEEFEEKKKTVLVKIPNEMLEYLTPVTRHLDKTNIFVMERILNNSKLRDNENVQYWISEILDGSSSKTNAEAKCQIIDKFLDNPTLFKNKSIKNSLGKIISTSYPKSVDYTCRIIDKAIEEDVVDKANYLGQIVYSVTQYGAPIAEEILEDEFFYDNESMIENIIEIVSETYSEEECDRKLGVMRKIKNSEALMRDFGIDFHLGEIVTNYSPESIDVLDHIFNNPELSTIMDNFLFWDISLDDLFSKINSEKEVKAKCDILDKLLESGLFNNGNVANSIVPILLEVKTKEDVSGMYKFVSKLQDDENMQTIIYEGNYPLASKMLGLYHVNDINEITVEERKKLLIDLMSIRDMNFNISEEFEEAFPLAPYNEDEYRELVIKIAKSIN